MLQEAPLPQSSCLETRPEMLRALIVGKGLDGLEEITSQEVGAPVRILIPRPGSEGIAGTPVERFVTELVAGVPSDAPADVVELVPIETQGELLGAVAMLGPAVCAEDPREILGAAAVAGLTAVAMLNVREETGGADPDKLIADLLAGETPRPAEIVRRAVVRGCDLTKGLTALCIDPPDRHLPGHLIGLIAATRPDVLAEPVDGVVHALIPGPVAGARKLAASLDGQGTHALSSHYLEAARAGQALAEAQMLMNFARLSGHPDTGNPIWEPMRLLYRAYLADPEALIRFTDDVVGELIAYDELHDSELRKTLRLYVECNCSMKAAAGAIFTHRQTVANRLARIYELTGLDPVRNQEREVLSLALQAYHLINRMRPS